jgi:hypothetical protein
MKIALLKSGIHTAARPRMVAAKTARMARPKYTAFKLTTGGGGGIPAS